MKLSIYQYKQDQGRLTRGITFWLSAALILYGCQSFYFFLHWPWAERKLIDGLIPVVNLPVNLALIISVVVFIVALSCVVWFINRPKLGNLLIETETEMKKVTWPSWGDSFNSSIVVLVAVIFFMIFLGVADIVLKFLFSNIVFGGLA